MALPNQNANNDAKDRPESDDGDFGNSLISYVTPRIEHARDTRDAKYEKRWLEYTRLWRGFWSAEDKTTDSERSKLISPALQQAIEMTASEIEEATFGRTQWFDIRDDIADEDKSDAIAYRDQLLEDFDLGKVPQACSSIFLLGCVYGTGIGKLNVERKIVKTAVGGQTQTNERVLVKLEPVRPDEFLIDPSATCIDDAHFVAHEMIKPLHSVRAKMREGIYRKVRLGAYTGVRQSDVTGTGRDSHVDPMDDAVLITEYFGKVPATLLPDAEGQGLVEALVTIANDSVILRAVESPFTNQDRPLIAYQHDVVPGEFWGRGIAEKGYNPQKALDAELRARMDGLALVTSPMLGADITKLPRNPDLRVRPGKVFLTRGRASEAIEPIGLNAQGLALSFQQSGDLERMVQMGTGAMDSAISVNSNRRNETASGMSQINAGFLKRAKRTMYNIERQFLGPMIRRALWRYMQFDPGRYPTDQIFNVKSTMGLMAREVETNTLTQMLAFVPPGSPAHSIITAAVLENTNSSQKGEIKKAVEAMLAPPSEEELAEAAEAKQLEKAFQQEQLKFAQLANAEVKAKVTLLLAQAQLAAVKADLEDERVEIEAANAVTNAENARNRQRDVLVKREIGKRGSNNGASS
jgi:hypothetical protein